MSRRPAFVPFDHSVTADGVIGYSSAAAELELTDEAALRQFAANKLLTVLSDAVDFRMAGTGDIAGCFLAVKILTADATALHEAAAECRRVARCVGGVAND